MASAAPESHATLSVLDRLIDEEPANAYEAPLSHAESVRILKKSLRRDLESLLNSRRIAVPPADYLRELNKSVYIFGIPDLASFALAAEKERNRLLRVLQTAIKLFEPRLLNARVVPVDTQEAGRSRLAFRIEGVLLMDPSPERVSFDTVLELANGGYKVRGEPDA